MTVRTERRTRLRKRPVSLVYVELPPSNGGMMRDLSEQGFSVRAMMPLQLSEKVPFVFSFDNGVRIDGEAIVVRIADHGHVAALEFAGLPAHSRDHIRRWLAKSDEPLARDAALVKQPAPPASTLSELRQEARNAIARPPAPIVEHEVEPSPPSAVPPPPPSPPQVLPAQEQAQQAAPLSPLAPPATPPAEFLSVERAQRPVPPVPPSTPILLVPQQSPPPPATPEPVFHTLEQPQEFAPPWLPAMQFLQAPKPLPPSLPPSQTAPPPPPPPPPPPVEPLPEEAQQLALSSLPAQPQPTPPPPRIAEHTELPQPPPLLKLSSVRPSLASEVPPEPSFAIPPAKPVAPPPPPVPIQDLLIPPPSLAAVQTAHPREVIPPPPLRPAPALEPLSSLEAETDAASPGWMERFTFGRAIAIMLLLTFLVGSFVYHRELGHGLIWLGHQISGDESSENSQTSPPSLPSTTAVSPEPTPPSAATIPPDSTPPAAAANENKTSEPVPAAANLPASQLKDTSANASASAPEENRLPPPSAPAASSSDTGEQEYRQAAQILHAPNRKAELPEAIRLLWIAVKKGNVGAEITLAELYHHGRGVPKSCDQTRILLSAAARKGSPDAQARLQEFRNEGCHD